jgi:hypothetical protein
MKTSTFVTYASAIALIGVASLAQANPTSSFTGAYAGVNVGADQSRVEQNANGAKSKKASHAFTGGFFTGYGQSFGDLYTGLEAFVDANNQKKSVTSTVKYKSDLAYGVTARVGGLVTPTAIVYGSLGAGYGKDSYTVTTGATETSYTKKSIAFIPGIGAEVMIPDTNVSARVDLTHQLARKVTTPAGTFKATKTALKVGVAYRF